MLDAGMMLQSGGVCGGRFVANNLKRPRVVRRFVVFLREGNEELELDLAVDRNRAGGIVLVKCLPVECRKRKGTPARWTRLIVRRFVLEELDTKSEVIQRNEQREDLQY
jgi:hypothetical protein